MQVFGLGTRPPKLWGRVEFGGRAWYNVKFLSIMYNFFAVTETLSLSVYEPIAIQILLGGIVPQFGRGVELGGREWYPVKLVHICYNLFAGT